MTIKPIMSETYKKWPFRIDLENGRTNIGAIDLTKEPDRIDEIHELKHTPKLKTAIYNLNKESSALMTLGCLIEKDPEQEVYWSYLEFCFRPNIDTSNIDLWKIDEGFFKLISENYGITFAEQLSAHLSWEAFEIELYGNTQCLAYSVFYPSRLGYHDLDNFYPALLNYLRQTFDHLA